MYENETNPEYWEQIAKEMGEEIGVDTREGSVYMDTQAGHILRVTKFFNDLLYAYNMLAVDTCYGDILTQKAGMDGVERKLAAQSYWTGIFDGATPNDGAIFMCGDYYFVWTDVDGTHYLVATVTGTESNRLIPGSVLTPLVNIDGLISATLGELVIPGTDDETDDSLRARWKNAKQAPVGNANRKQYKLWCESVSGIGRAIIMPLWGGSLTVKAVLFSADGTAVTEEVVRQVQEYIDPIEYGYVVNVDGKDYTFGDGVGEGVADICAHFLAESAKTYPLNIVATVTLASGKTIENAQTSAMTAISSYLTRLTLETPDGSNVVVRISSIASMIQNLEEVVDYEYDSLLVNGSNENIVIQEDYAATLTEVVFNAR